jgi:hypothetical protein
MTTFGGVDIYIEVFVTSAQVGAEWSASHLRCFTTREAVSDTHSMVQVGLRAGLNAVEQRKFFNLSELKLRSFGHPAHIQLQS